MALTTEGVQLRKVDIIHTSAQTMPQSVLPKASLATCLAPAVASGVLLWMCFFPLAWGWLLGWVALMPLLCLVRVQAAPRRIYCCAYAAGSVFFWPALFWMPVNSHMIAAYALLAIYCALYFPVALWVIRLIDRKTILPLMISVPIAWTALEFVRSFLLTGFAWYYLGHSQHTMLSLIQIADLGGVYLISFLVAAVNAWLFDVLYQFPGLRDACRWHEPKHLDDRSRPLAGGSVWRPGLKYEAGLLLVAIVCALIYGTWRLGQNQFQEGPLLALLQTNLGQDIRDEAHNAEQRHSTVDQTARHLDKLCPLAIKQAVVPDLVVWPETSYLPQFPWLESSPQLPLDKIPELFLQAEVAVQKHLRRELLKIYPANHLLGLATFTLETDLKERRYNSALFVQKDGRFAGRYDKIHRVPFGEYVPLRWLPLVDRIAPYDFDYSISEGENYTRFGLGKHKFGVLICYEDTDPSMARKYVRTALVDSVVNFCRRLTGHDENAQGPPVDFLINMSNDGWFDGTSEHDEHLAISRFRAIECRRALARSVNMGISAVIDGNGRVLEPDELPPPREPHLWKITDDRELPVSAWRSFKQTSGVLLARVPIDTRASFYAATGDVLPIGCLVVIGGVAAWSLWTRKRKLPLTA